MFRSLLALGLLDLVRLCAAQQSGWQPGQVNVTMCYWDSPRVAVVRDTAYIDGGALWWTPGMQDGSYGTPTSDDNPLGIVYQLNFSTPFNTTPQTNISSILTTTSKAPAGGAANNVAPNYYSGAMLANDYEWFIYGGSPTLTGKYVLPGSQAAAAYEVYASGPPKQFHAGYVLELLPDGITRYITNGAGVSVPSENLGFYFAGLRAANFGPILYQSGDPAQNADALSNTMIQLDMTTQDQEVWKNISLTTVPGRISPEIVWVPVSKQGVLVAIGGVVEAQFTEYSTVLSANQTADTKLKSPLLMSTVSIYDISTSTWYNQSTSGTPPGMLTQGCTVVASAQDGSSHNIYWYGGWSGIDQTQPFSDDVWILSLPTFTWMKISTGTPSHGRAGHRCVKPYPDQMLVIGGYPTLSGSTLQCLPDSMIRVFNLSSATWIQKYDPAIWSNYSVPTALSSVISGTAPSPTGFANKSLETVFGTAYNMSKISNWYPYHAASTTAPPRNITTITPAPNSGSSTPSYLGPVLGVVLGLFFLTLAIVAYLIWRRRHLFRSSVGVGGQSENGTMDNRRWVTNWLRATPVDAKAPTVTTDETPVSPYGDEDPLPSLQEVQGREVFEMGDTSNPVELHSNPNSNPHSTPQSHSSQPTNLHPLPMAQIPSYTSSPSTSPLPQNSELHPSPSIASNTSRPPVSPVHHSPLLGVGGMDGFVGSGVGGQRDKFISGLSNLSDSDRGHLRGISETSVSTDGAGAGAVGGGFVTPFETPGLMHTLGNDNSLLGGGEGVVGRDLDLGVGEGERNADEELNTGTEIPPAVPDPPTRGVAVSPLTPPQGVGREGGDYLGAKEGGSGNRSPGTRRRSNFSEELGGGE